jgi:hypothetical protein
MPLDPLLPLPAMPLVPLVPLLPAPLAPDEVPLLQPPPLLPLPLSAEPPVAPLPELVPPEVPLLPVPLLVVPELPLPVSLLPLPRMELHADRDSTSRPAISTLNCCRFMINSFGGCFRMCVTMPRATSVRGANRGDVPVAADRP